MLANGGPLALAGWPQGFWGLLCSWGLGVSRNIFDPPTKLSGPRSTSVHGSCMAALPQTSQLIPGRKQAVGRQTPGLRASCLSNGTTVGADQDGEAQKKPPDIQSPLAVWCQHPVCPSLSLRCCPILSPLLGVPPLPGVCPMPTLCCCLMSCLISPPMSPVS